MKNALKKIGKLKGRTFRELRVRGAQALAARAERAGLSSLARLPSDVAFFKLLDPARYDQHPSSPAGLLAHFRTRGSPRFFAGFADKEATQAELRSRFGGVTEAAVLARATRIREGRFDLLGLHDLSFGNPVDWHLEPVAGIRNSRVHWSQIDFLERSVSGDKKITWELNRHQFFQQLGRAYWRTGDESYAESYVAYVTSWMDANPPKSGINWASSLEVSFRVISWLWALYFFKDSAHLTPSVFIRLWKFLYVQARHLETYLSTYFSPNTHLTGEALGLYYLGTLLPEFKAATRWRETGQRILFAELSRQVQPDGVYFEQSTYYHRYTTDFYLHFAILTLANEKQLDRHLSEKLAALLDHLMFITRPDGTSPYLGDDDGGRLVMLDERPANDFRAALSNGAALFGRADYKFVAGEAAEETLWLLGSAGVQAFDALAAERPAQTSRAFADGGYYVMRDGWAANSNYLLFDCGPHGGLHCGHAHADALAFELAARGRTLLVDPGTYTYTGSKELRDWFRSSPAHNALTVDGESSSVPAGPFSWSTIARSEAQVWISRARFDYFEGQHDGYQRLVPPVAYSRGVLFLKNDYWVVRDRVKSAGKHRYDLWFHFEIGAAPRLQFADDSGASVREMDGAAGLEISSFGQNASWRREDASVSHCYGERGPAPVYVFSASLSATTGGGDLVTFLMPRAKAEPARHVCEVEAIGGHAFELVGESAYDIVMIRQGDKDGGRVEMARMASDFEWTWARFSHEGAVVPDELVLIGGQRLELEGKEVLRSGRRISYLVASRVGDQFRIETDDGVLELSLPIHDFESAFSKAESRQ